MGFKVKLTEVHPSLTEDRVLAACSRTIMDGENIGFCVACGEEAHGVEPHGVEPDAEMYECQACMRHRVFGAEWILRGEMYHANSPHSHDCCCPRCL